MFRPNSRPNLVRLEDRSVPAALARSSLAAAAAGTYSTSATTVSLYAAVTSGGARVMEGGQTFALFNGSTAGGSPVTVNVVNGSAVVSYALPAANCRARTSPRCCCR